MIDVKGMATDTAKLKAKLFRYKYPDVMLTWICKAPKYTGLEWIEYDELIKVRRKREGEQERRTSNAPNLILLVTSTHFQSKKSRTGRSSD